MTTHSLDAFRLKDGMEFLHHAPLALHCQHFRAPGLFFISVVITCRLKDIITLFFLLVPSGFGRYVRQGHSTSWWRVYEFSIRFLFDDRRELGWMGQTKTTTGSGIIMGCAALVGELAGAVFLGRCRRLYTWHTMRPEVDEIRSG